MKLFKRLGIDLGTANSIVYVAGQGIVLEEPTVVAVSLPDRTVVAVGNLARQMLGRTPDSIVASRPMRDGVIADYSVTEAMLRYFIRTVMGRWYLVKPEVMICVPAGCTQVERRAVRDATLQAGARRVFLIDEPLAAAIGAGLPIAEAGGNMIVDVGGGAAEAAVISLGGVVVHESARVGGNKLDEAIAQYVRKKHNLIIGDQTAEWVKIRIGEAVGEEKKVPDVPNVSEVSKASQAKAREKTFGTDSLEVKGRDAITGLPRAFSLTREEVTQAIQAPLLSIVGVIKRVLERVPPELSSDIIDRGIVMSGGTSMLKNFPKFVTAETGVPAYVAEDAIHCVAKGTGIALEHFDEYRRVITQK